MHASWFRVLRRRATQRLSTVEKGTRRASGKPGAMFGLRSAQGRAGAAILVLLVLLGSVAAAAAWRAQKDQALLDSVGHRTTAATAIEKARSEYFHSATQLSAAVLAEDPTPLIDSFHQGVAAGDQAVLEARGELAALGDTDTVAALDSFIEELQQQLEEVDGIFDSAAASNVPLMTLFSQPRSLQIWERVQTQLAELDGLANEQDAKLAAERAAADSSAEATLALMLGLSAFAFLVGAATLIVLVTSVARPLASLQESARAFAAGDLEARARVAGPEEVASLARDFNEMVAQRKQAEEAVRESEERYRDLFENANDLIQSVAPDGSFIYVNRAWREALGYSEEETSGLSLMDIIHPDSKAHCAEAFQRVITRGNIDRVEAMFVAKDGRTITVEGSANCSFKDGKPVATRGIFRDISERKQAEEALRESEARYRSIFESIQDVFYRTDAEGIITEISPSIERFGYSREALIGMQVLGVYDNPEERSGLLKTLLEQERVADYEIRLKRGDGSLIDISVSSHVLRGPDGTFSGVAGTLRDISERKKTEEALRESEEKIRVITHTAMDAIIMIDNDGRVSYWNPAAERLFGYAAQEALGKKLHPLITPPELLPSYRKAFSRFRSAGGGAAFGKTLELSALRRDRTEFPIEISLSAVKIGEKWHAIGVVRDISERKAAEEALREQARRDALTGALNHGAIVDEIRNLISKGKRAAPWALAMIDVNHLKAVNDTCGHQVGDAVLVAIATALSQDDALVGRYGGDEFVAILRGADRAAAEEYRNKATDTLRDATVTDPQTGACVLVAASIGLAIYPEDGSTLVDLIKTSDDAMYAAKRQRPVQRPSRRKRAPAKKAA